MELVDLQNLITNSLCQTAPAQIKEKNILMRIIFLFSISLPPSLSSPHQLDIAEGGRISGVINQHEGISSAEPKVRIVEPLLLAGGRED